MRVVAIIIDETIKKKKNLSLSCFFHGKQAQPRQAGAITGYANFLVHDSIMYQKMHMIRNHVPKKAHDFNHVPKNT
jgi:hypothetical protein